MGKNELSRHDLLVWYSLAFVLMSVLVGTMYFLGFIGNIEHGSIIDSNQITAAAIENVKNTDLTLTEEVNTSSDYILSNLNDSKNNETYDFN